MECRSRKFIIRGITGIAILAVLNTGLALYAMKTGSLNVTWAQLMSGLFKEYDETVALIYNLRFPRILVALLSGAALSVSGLLLQSALKNPLADPGIIGISGGSELAGAMLMAFAPQLFAVKPIIACIGGMAVYMLIYALSRRHSTVGIRIILVGIAVAAVLEGVNELFSGMSNASGVSLTVSGLTQLTWKDVRLLSVYVLIGIAAAAVLAPSCNIMALSDETVSALGVNVNRLRLVTAAVAVWLSAGVTAVTGVISFLALIVPHMSRRMAGSDNRILVPFTMLLGAFVMLAADTAGRLMFAPNELSANVLMSIGGGIFFIYLLCMEGKSGGVK